jgi:hypothetical protein
MMMMTTSHETATDAARHGQEAFTWPQKVWDAKWHDAVEFVDKTFDFYHHVLACQREFVKSWLAITTWAEHKVAPIVHDAAKDMYGVAKEATPKRDMHDGVKDVAPKRS